MATDTSVKQALIATTQAATERDIFGVPTFYLDGQIFWGEDRIEDLIRCAQGLRIDEAKLAAVLGRDAAVQRKR